MITYHLKAALATQKELGATSHICWCAIPTRRRHIVFSGQLCPVDIKTFHYTIPPCTAAKTINLTYSCLSLYTVVPRPSRAPMAVRCGLLLIVIVSSLLDGLLALLQYKSVLPRHWVRNGKNDTSGSIARWKTRLTP